MLAGQMSLVAVKQRCIGHDAGSLIHAIAYCISSLSDLLVAAHGGACAPLGFYQCLGYHDHG